MERYGLEPLFQERPEKVNAVLKEYGWRGDAHDFICYIYEKMEKRESDFFAFEGYWQKYDKTKTRDMLVTGAVYTKYDGQIRYRGILVKGVPERVADEVTDDLTFMMLEYLGELEREAYRRHLHAKNE